MKVLNFKDMITGSEDDFLYFKIISILNQIKITQGGTALDYTLKRHPKILNYCKAKQLKQIKYIEDTYFFENGALDSTIISEWHMQHPNYVAKSE